MNGQYQQPMQQQAEPMAKPSPAWKTKMVPLNGHTDIVIKHGPVWSGMTRYGNKEKYAEMYIAEVTNQTVIEGRGVNATEIVNYTGEAVWFPSSSLIPKVQVIMKGGSVESVPVRISMKLIAGRQAGQTLTQYDIVGTGPGTPSQYQQAPQPGPYQQQPQQQQQQAQQQYSQPQPIQQQTPAPVPAPMPAPAPVPAPEPTPVPAPAGASYSFNPGTLNPVEKACVEEARNLVMDTKSIMSLSNFVQGGKEDKYKIKEQRANEIYGIYIDYINEFFKKE